MAFQGLDRGQAQAVWQPFFDRLRAMRDDVSVDPEPRIVAIPARRLWDPADLRALPGLVLADDRPGAPYSNLFWSSNFGEVGRVWHAYQSAWLPASLLQADRQRELGDALFAAAKHAKVTLHVNKGLAGAAAGAIASARNTAMNPTVLDAFALLISSAGEPPAYPGIAGHTPDVALAREGAATVDAAMREIRALVPSPGSYLNESDFFDAAWRESFWGSHYARLLAVKDRYDPDGLFYAHHGVGSERWSADGFTRTPAS